jgi:hypothetical protein
MTIRLQILDIDKELLLFFCLEQQALKTDYFVIFAHTNIFKLHFMFQSTQIINVVSVMIA